MTEKPDGESPHADQPEGGEPAPRLSELKGSGTGPPTEEAVQQPDSSQSEKPDMSQRSPIDQEALTGFQRLKKGLSPGVIKTMLDPDAMRRVVSRLSSDKEARLRDQPPPPLKPFKQIEQYRKASPCGMRWDQMKGEDRVRYCEKCQLQVYDFTKLELPDAEELIFQREAKKNFVLYKRRDGKFLTSDCPVGAKSTQYMLLAVAFGALLLIGLVVLVLLMPPPRPASPPGTEAATGVAGGQSPGKTSPSELRKKLPMAGKSPPVAVDPSKLPMAGQNWSSPINQSQLPMGMKNQLPAAGQPAAPIGMQNQLPASGLPGLPMAGQNSPGMTPTNVQPSKPTGSE